MGLNDLGSMDLGFYFSSQDAASGTVKSLNGNVRDLKASGEQAGVSMMNSFGKIAKGATMMAAGIEGMRAVYEPAIHAETRLTDVLVRYGTTAALLPEQLAQLQSATTSMRQEMHASEADIASAFTVLAGSKIAVGSENMKDLARAGLMVSAVMGMGVAEATEAAAQATDIFGLKASQSITAMSQLTEIAKRSHMNFGELSMAVARSGKEINVMGLDLPGFGALMMGLAENGYRGRNMISGLQQAMQGLTDSTGPFAKGLGKIGIYIHDAAGNIRPTAAIIGSLQRAIVGLDDQRALAKFRNAFGTQAPLALALARTSFEGLREEVGKFDGLADSYNAKMGTTAEKSKHLGEAVTALSQTVGGPLLASLKSGTDSMGGWIEMIREYLAESPKVNDAVGKAALGISGIGIATGAAMAAGGLSGLLGGGGIVAGMDAVFVGMGNAAVTAGAAIAGAGGAAMLGMGALAASTVTGAILMGVYWDDLGDDFRRYATILTSFNPIAWAEKFGESFLNIRDRWDETGDGIIGEVNKITLVMRETGAAWFDSLMSPFKAALDLMAQIPGRLGEVGKKGSAMIGGAGNAIRGQGPEKGVGEALYSGVQSIEKGAAEYRPFENLPAPVSTAGATPSTPAGTQTITLDADTIEKLASAMQSRPITVNSKLVADGRELASVVEHGQEQNDELGFAGGALEGTF